MCCLQWDRRRCRRQSCRSRDEADWRAWLQWSGPCRQCRPQSKTSVRNSLASCFFLIHLAGFVRNNLELKTLSVPPAGTNNSDVAKASFREKDLKAGRCQCVKVKVSDVVLSAE